MSSYQVEQYPENIQMQLCKVCTWYQHQDRPAGPGIFDIVIRNGSKAWRDPLHKTQVKAAKGFWGDTVFLQELEVKDKGIFVSF